MRKESLTAKQVEHMKARASRYEVPAGPPKGLYLVVHPTGAKSWCFRYRFAGHTRKLTYTDLTLAAARAEAEAAVDDLDQGIDPRGTKANEDAAEQRGEHEKQLQQESVQRVVEEFIKRGLKKKEKERGETERILRREVIKPWQARVVADIRKPDVLNLLDAIVDRGVSVMACRTRGVLLRFFKFARKRGYLDLSPMIDVDKPGPDHEDRDRVLEPSELAEIWTITESLDYPLGPYMRFLTLTAQRRGEVASMRWPEVDLDKALWTLPATITKNGHIHYLPLSTAAVEILKSLPRFKNGDYVWTTTGGQKAVNGFSKAKERIDAATLKQREPAGMKKNIPDWTMHDIRRTAATLMAEKCGVLPHVLSAVLNHTDTSRQNSRILKIYNRYEYLDEKRAALQAWADYVVSLEEKQQKAATA